MAIDDTKNLAFAVTTSAITTTSQTTFDVDDASALPSPPFNIAVFDDIDIKTAGENGTVEYMRCTGIATNTLTVTRDTEAEGTNQTFSTGAKVWAVDTADTWSRLTVEAQTGGASEKTDPVTADKIPIVDSEDGNSLKYASPDNVGGKKWEVLDTQTLGADASEIVYTDLDFTAYSEYAVHIMTRSAANSTVDLHVFFSDDNGSTYETQYDYTSNYIASSLNNQNATSAAQIKFLRAVSNTNVNMGNGVLRIMEGKRSTSDTISCVYTGSATAPDLSYCFGTGNISLGATVNAVKLEPSIGDFDTDSTFVLVGLKR